MIDRVTQVFVWLRRRSFFRVVQRTLVMLMPVATIGAYFQLLKDGIFSPDSLIYNIFNFDYTMPDVFWNAGNAVSAGMVKVTFGIFGIYAAYFSAVYTARLYKKDSTMAGIASVIVITFCSYLSEFSRSNSMQANFYSRILSINGILLALCVGYIVGQVFHFLGKNYVHSRNEHILRIQHRAWNALLPTIASVTLGLILGVVIYLFKIRLLDTYYFKSIVSSLENSNNLLIIILLTMLTSFLWWSGIGYPLTSLTTSTNSGAALANMNYALRHGNAQDVPYKYLGSSMVHSYGIMGDASIVLALTVVILIYTHNREIEAVAKANLLPVAFGSPNGLFIGLPILLNPIYLLPCLLIPALNELIAAGAISLRLISPSVYPVLSGTPGILISFFGSNGNWPTFIFTLLLFTLDVVLMIPVIQIGQQIAEKLTVYDEEEYRYAK